MSIAEIKRFAADLKSNEALRAEAGTAQAKESVVAFAATKGYAFTADEVKEYAKATAKAAGKELTDAELDDVAGGAEHITLDPLTGTPTVLIRTR
jgi:predicted ribosomally synthesized peptide with nif11-like leader